MQRSSTTAPSAADSAATRGLEQPDADAYAGLLRDLEEELQEPPEFVRRAEDPHVARAGMAA